MDRIEIRDAKETDGPRIEALLRDAFPGEDLIPLTRQLLAQDCPALAIVAVQEDRVIGLILFTECHLAETGQQIALLGPLGVASKHQRQGVGRTLVHAGLARLAETAMAAVCVLGDPGYYGRFGFAAETAITPPCPIPEAWGPAWQSRALKPRASPVAGSLSVPVPWRDPALWSDRTTSA